MPHLTTVKVYKSSLAKVAGDYNNDNHVATRPNQFTSHNQISPYSDKIYLYSYTSLSMAHRSQILFSQNFQSSAAGPASKQSEVVGSETSPLLSISLSKSYETNSYETPSSSLSSSAMPTLKNNIWEVNSPTTDTRDDNLKTFGLLMGTLGGVSVLALILISIWLKHKGVWNQVKEWIVNLLQKKKHGPDYNIGYKSGNQDKMKLDDTETQTKPRHKSRFFGFFKKKKNGKSNGFGLNWLGNLKNQTSDGGNPEYNQNRDPNPELSATESTYCDSNEKQLDFLEADLSAADNLPCQSFFQAATNSRKKSSGIFKHESKNKARTSTNNMSTTLANSRVKKFNESTKTDATLDGSKSKAGSVRKTKPNQDVVYKTTNSCSSITSISNSSEMSAGEPNSSNRVDCNVDTSSDSNDINDRAFSHCNKSQKSDDSTDYSNSSSSSNSEAVSETENNDELSSSFTGSGKSEPTTFSSSASQSNSSTSSEESSEFNESTTSGASSESSGSHGSESLNSLYPDLSKHHTTCNSASSSSTRSL